MITENTNSQQKLDFRNPQGPKPINLELGYALPCATHV